MLYDSQQHPEDGTTAAPTVPSRSNALNFANSNFVPQVDLPSKTTTTASLTDVNAFIHQDGSRETYPVAASAAGLSVLEPKLSHSMDGSATEDTASIQSCNPTVEPAGDVESLLGEILANGIRSPSLNSAEARLDPGMRPGSLTGTEPLSQEAFEQEFQELDELNETGDNLEERISRWKSRLKHFFILSSAGKPIYTRHGDESLVSSYIGIMQTVISFYEASNDTIKGFSTSKARFVIVIQGPLYLVAISRLGESDSQLRAQLEALYMQVLSTLTLPNLTHMFCNRPSTDLRRPLQGTEPLLSSLADSFTRGSFPTLLSALECLKMRKSHRQSINNTLLKLRSPNLLYGLIVAGGRLVSVVRPKKHSLHPTDLQLIFNMLFEADGIKAGGGENWIPLCLPGYNRNGYLYMYVGFLGDNNNFNANSESAVPLVASREDEIAVLLISAKKESFFELKEMRDNVVQVRSTIFGGNPPPPPCLYFSIDLHPTCTL
ncbi:MAG: Vacuolar fusion protein mon1 [Trizodia sp. TS-e1964]|nr:MAG: Vacuolar fusion protein mon1 [Trizodia sp. TS-e1964]